MGCTEAIAAEGIATGAAAVENSTGCSKGSVAAVGIETEPSGTGYLIMDALAKAHALEQLLAKDGSCSEDFGCCCC